MTTTKFDWAFQRVEKLVTDFRANEERYCSGDYNEHQARLDFIDKFFIELGWDVNHVEQTNPYAQEVKVERAFGFTQRHADYVFFAPNCRDARFCVEAKRPQGEISTADHYFQTVRYGSGSGTPLAVLTSFRQFHILDTRFKADIRTVLNRAVATYQYNDYADRDEFAKIYWLFSREAVADGSLEKFSATLRKKDKGIPSPHRQNIDDAFLDDLEKYRDRLAHAFKAKNPSLNSEEITEITQRTLDRLVFLRFLEDKQIEEHQLVARFTDKDSAWKNFVIASRRLDGIYNGVVFKEHAILDATSFRADNEVFADICRHISDPHSPYDFNAIPIHILGSIYERFLGHVVVATDKRVHVEEKPEVRKAGGVYYTPEYIVRYIVENTVDKLIEGKTPDQIVEMRFVDIACGSGSFLLGIYDWLLRYHGHYYNENRSKARKGDCVERDGNFYLSLRKKREILLKNLYGVDIDAQAVEVCQMSLYLKLLEEETTASTHQYLLDFERQAMLPSLRNNIVCGNSLIGRDILEGQSFISAEERELSPMNFADVFPEVMKRGGFDAIVGNPPYRMLQPHNTTQNVLAYLRSHYVAAEFKIDLFHLFLQRAASLLKDTGRFSYIVPTALLNNVYAKKIRDWLAGHCCIEQIAVARGRVFPDADVHTSILVFRREPSETQREDQEVLTTDQLSPEFAATQSFDSRTRQATFASLPGHVWNILVNDKNSSLIRRLTTDYEPLEKIATINRGLITGDRDKYFAKTKESAQYVPILAGSDVHRYHAANPSEFVLFKRPKTSGGCWDEQMHFAPHKLVVRQICEEPTASIIRTPLAITGNIFSVRADSVETELYLLGIINARLTGFFWRTMFADFKTSFPQVTIFSLAQVPVRLLGLSDPAQKMQHDQMVRLVEQMLEAKTQLMAAQTDKDKSYYESKCVGIDNQIDRLVYDLYGLTEEEIGLVEGIAK